MADVVQINSGTQNTQQTDTTASLPIAAAENNLLILVVSSDATVSTPAGWTLETGLAQVNFSGNYVFWRLAPAGFTNVAYTNAAATISTWVLAEVSGIDQADPYDVSDGQLSGTGGANYVTPAITPSAGEKYLVGVIAATHSSQVVPSVSEWTNSFTEQADPSGTVDTPQSVKTSYADRSVVADGSTTYSTGATFDDSTDSRYGMIVAFNVAGDDNEVTGTADSSLGSLVATATGQRATFGTASATLGALTATASGTPTTFGVASANLDNLNGSATGIREHFGGASAELGEVVAEAFATAARQGFAEAILGGLLAAGVGRRTTTGTAQINLGALTATAEGFLAGTVFGDATAILGGLTATARGGGNLVDLISVADIEEAIGREAFSAEEEAQWISYIKMVSNFIQSKVKVGFSQTTIEATYQADSYGQVSLWEPVIDIEWVRNFRTGNDDLWVDWDGVNKLMYLEPHQTIKVRYTYGYSEVPDDIKELATTLVMAQINEIGIPGGLRRYKVGDVEEQYNPSITTGMLDQMTNDVLDNYRRVWYSIPISIDVFPDYQPQGFATDFDDD